MDKFFNFDSMITPIIIKIVFWIGLGASVLTGLGIIITGLEWGGGIQVIGGLLIIVVGPIIVRIYCELLIIMFKMHEALQDIRQTLKK